MEFKIQGNIYKIRQIESITTPRLLVFENRIDENIDTMKSILGSGFPAQLIPHAKTNKSVFTTSKMVHAGICAFKATPNEVEMLVRANSKEIFISYPLLQTHAEKLAELVIGNPHIKFYVQAGCREHLNILEKTASGKGITWNCFADIDVGMHRTGTEPVAAIDLVKKICNSARLNFSGLHGYDGHNHNKTAAERLAESEKSMGKLITLFNDLTDAGIEIPAVIAGGSPAFEDDFNILQAQIGNATRVFVSPGTWIYWDSKYNNLLPGKFSFAALVLAQVIEAGDKYITLNLGHKRWAADQGVVDLFSREGLQVISFSEEHTVLSHSGKYQIGDFILIVPKHVCPTINLYSEFTLIDKDGNIKTNSVPVDGRNQ